MNIKLDKIYVEISAGELVDKITILEIKKEKISNVQKLTEINKELNLLTEIFNKAFKKSDEIFSLREKC